MVFFEGALKALGEAMPNFVETGKYKWEEASSAFQIFTGETDIEKAFPEGFLPFVKAKKLIPSSPLEQLGVAGLTKGYPETFNEDHRCRQAFLASFTLYLGNEAMQKASSDDLVSRAARALSKQALLPLNFIFQAFLKGSATLHAVHVEGRG